MQPNRRNPLENSAWGAWGARAQETKVSKTWNLPLTLKKPSIRSAAIVLPKARKTLYPQLDCIWNHTCHANLHNQTDRHIGRWTDGWPTRRTDNLSRQRERLDERTTCLGQADRQIDGQTDSRTEGRGMFPIPSPSLASLWLCDNQTACLG